MSENVSSGEVARSLKARIEIWRPVFPCFTKQQWDAAAAVTWLHDFNDTKEHLEARVGMLGKAYTTVRISSTIASGSSAGCGNGTVTVSSLSKDPSRRDAMIACCTESAHALVNV